MDEKDLLKKLTTKDVLLSLTPIVDAKIVAYFKKEAGWLSPRIEKSMKLAQEMQPKSFDRVTSTMTVGTSEEQVNRTKETPEAELEYFGICMFGSTETLREFTGKFSLFQ